jgi:5'-nucleotidase
MVLGAGVALSPSILAASQNTQGLEKLTILHTNDTHSNIDTFPDDHAKYPNRGGVARRKTILDEIRREEKNVLLLDAGDFFQGTPYFNLYQGTLELKLMTWLGYDAATLGNHDFDIGLEGFQKAKEHADFPFLCANYNFDNTILKGHTKPYQVFQKGRFKVGVFGVGVELDGLVPAVHYGDTVWESPIDPANRIAKHLRYEEDCDLVVCLSHLGHIPRQFKMCDPVFAKETANIDLIIGGHSHTFMDKPEVHKNKEGRMVLINQVGWAGLALGRIDFFLGETKRHKGYELVLV